jgi:hypothetical protein
MWSNKKRPDCCRAFSIPNVGAMAQILIGMMM